MIKRFGFFLLLGLFLALSISSCKGFKKESRKAVAKVYDFYLYEDELLEEIPFGLTERDSTIYATNFINNWISQKLLLHQAESNLSDLRKDFSEQLEEYRQSLTIYAYERELILQKLDTLVSEEQIESFYAENKVVFLLKENIVKVVYIKAELKAPNINLVKNYVKNATAEDIQKLEDYR